MAWRKTALSVSPAAIQVGSSDVETIAFDAGEAITDAMATVGDLDVATPDTLITDVAPEPTGANVTVSGFVRGHTYELAVTFERADGRRWTRTLIVECVA